MVKVGSVKLIQITIFLQRDKEVRTKNKNLTDRNHIFSRILQDIFTSYDIMFFLKKGVHIFVFAVKSFLSFFLRMKRKSYNVNYWVAALALCCCAVKENMYV